MKAHKYIIPAIMGLCPVMMIAQQGISVKKTDGETLHIANSSIKSMTFDGDNAIITGAEGQVLSIDRSSVTDITPVDAVSTEYVVKFNGTQAEVINPYAMNGVTTVIDGAYVTTTNADVAQELTFRLSGSTADGAYTYSGDYKCTLIFDGVDITSQKDGAVSIKCGKRIAVNVLGDNTLADAQNGTQKACLYFKGHPEFTGSGTLNVSGYTAHAISTKEYLQLKKSFGTINVLYAENDGIHAGQYFQMNGGTVKVRGIKGDGIQSEATTETTDENNGQIIIKGGTIDLEITGDESDGIKSDSLLTISGGKITILASGATSKAIKSKGALTITDGDITAKVTGNGIVVTTETSASRGPGGPGGGGGWPGGWPGGFDQEDQETSAPGCIKADGLLTITGGTMTLSATGKGGKCINGEDLAVFGVEGGDGPVITASTTGAAVTGSGENLSGMPKAIKVYGDMTINSGVFTVSTTQNGGEGIECKSRLTINGGVISCRTYDDGINAGYKITVNDGIIYSYASNNDGMDCNGSEGFEFNGGIILASGTTSPEEGFDCDNYKFVINGGTVIGTGGATSNVTSAKQPFATTSGKSITAGKYLSLQKADGTVICSYKVPKSLSATVLVSSPEFVNGTACKLVINSTSVNNPEATYLDGIFTVGGTLSDGTSSSITPKTK